MTSVVVATIQSSVHKPFVLLACEGHTLVMYWLKYLAHNACLVMLFQEFKGTPTSFTPFFCLVMKSSDLLSFILWSCL